MDVIEVMNKKNNAQGAIQQIIDDFREQTGCAIEDVKIDNLISSELSIQRQFVSIRVIL